MTFADVFADALLHAPRVSEVRLEKAIAAMPILKIDAEQRVVFGIVLEPCTASVCTPDSQGDIVTSDEIEKAAHGFMVGLQRGEAHLDVDHEHRADASVVESMLVPADFQEGDPPQLVRKGTWYIGVKIHDDELWQSVKDGRRTAFSIGGVAERHPA